MTASDAHRKILEISGNISVARRMIGNLAGELKIYEENLRVHLKLLATLGLISFADNSVTITESGQKARLP